MYVNLESSSLSLSVEAVCADERQQPGSEAVPRYFADYIERTADDEGRRRRRRRLKTRQETFSASLNFRSISSIELFIVGSILGERVF
jgi:hypothetical protein